MKHLILFLTIVGFISCNTTKKENPEYNPQAVEMNNKGAKLLQHFKRDSALILFDQAIAIDNSYYLPHSNKIGIYLVKKEYEKALHESEMVIQLKPDLAEAWFMAGLLNEHQGNDKKALTYYKKSIRIFTDRINNPDKEKDINANKLNRALSKKFIGDDSYIKDFNELSKMENYAFVVNQFKDKSKKEIMNELIK